MDCESQHKTCVDCGEVKSLAAFIPTRFSDDGHSAKCRRCLFAAARLVCQARDRRNAERALGVRR